MSEQKTGNSKNESYNQMKKIFNQKLSDFDFKDNSVMIASLEKYEAIIAEVETAMRKNYSERTAKDLRRLARYDVSLLLGKKKLRAKKTNDKSVKYFVHNGELFDAIHGAHLKTGHGGRNKMDEKLNETYANITRHWIMTYIELCAICEKKRALPRKGPVVKPLPLKEEKSRCQVNLIDMQNAVDGEYKHILDYQDQHTKFCILKPLKSQKADEVADNLVDIFCMLGAPTVLQSGNGRDFVIEVIEALKLLWPDLAIVRGAPRRSQIEASVKKCNQDLRRILFAWIKKNNCKKWSEGLRFVQMQKNSSLHSGINQTPYEALFGRTMQLGLQNVPDSSLRTIHTEEEFVQIVDNCEQGARLAKDGERDQVEVVKEKPQDQEVIVKEEALDQEIMVKVEVEDQEKWIYEETLVKLEAQDVEELANREDSLKNLCLACNLDYWINKKCGQCDQPVHVVCGKIIEDKRKTIVLCYLCARKQVILANQQNALKNVTKQADKIVKLSNKTFPAINIGTSVKVQIPGMDFKNIIGIVLEKTPDEMYKIGTKHGILNDFYSREQIKPCKRSFLTIEEVKDVPICLGNKDSKKSKGGGQEFGNCRCFKNCDTKKCNCKKNGVHCNWKCHKLIITCKNK